MTTIATQDSGARSVASVKMGNPSLVFGRCIVILLDTGEKGGKAVINGYILSYDARTTNPKTRTEGRRPEQLTNQSRTAIRVQGEGLSFVTKIQPTEVEGMTSLAPGLFDIAERVRSMFSHACA